MANHHLKRGGLGGILEPFSGPLTATPIPDYVLRALSSWHECAIVYDPNNHSQQASERAVASWKAFEVACLQWEQETRVERRHFGPTGTA